MSLFHTRVDRLLPYVIWIVDGTFDEILDEICLMRWIYKSRCSLTNYCESISNLNLSNYKRSGESKVASVVMKESSSRKPQLSSLNASR